MDEGQFVQAITKGSHFTPRYFGYDVELNRRGAPSLSKSIGQIPVIHSAQYLQSGIVLIDTRPNTAFARGHIIGAINLQDGGKFETWLGSVISPDEKFYLLAETEEALHTVLIKAAKIGYEKNIKAGIISTDNGTEVTPELDLEQFKAHPEEFTIVDVRNPAEVNEGKHFDHALTIALPELRERLHEIPTGKPIVVHCAAGYRSAAASSIVQHFTAAKVPVYDLGEEIVQFSLR